MLSIAVMTHNEKDDIEDLASFLSPYLGAEVELVIVDDYSDTQTQEVLKGLASRPEVRVYSHKLNNHFARQRNYLRSHCRGRFMLVIDPDERPPVIFMEQFSKLAAMMEKERVDVCLMPRWNVFTDENGVVVRDGVNFPDYQERLLRRRPFLFWVNSVHERLFGYHRRFILPAEEKYALHHVKREAKNQSANAYYETLRKRRFDKYRKIIFKLLGLMPRGSVPFVAPF